MIRITDFSAAQTKSASAVTLSKKTSVKLTHFSYIPENNQSTLVFTGAEGKDIKDSDEAAAYSRRAFNEFKNVP